MTAPAAPHAAALATAQPLTLPVLSVDTRGRAFSNQQRLKRNDGATGRMFIFDSVLLYQNKRRRLWRLVTEDGIADDETSFHLWLKEHYRQSTTKGHLCVQVARYFLAYLKFSRRDLYAVGYAGFSIITPEVKKWIARAESYRGIPSLYALALLEAHAAASEWVERAKNLSTDDLAAAMTTDGLGRTKTPPVGSSEATAHSDNGWDVLRKPFPVAAGVMRKWTAEEWCDNMGLAGIPDDRAIFAEVKAGPVEPD